MRQISMRELRRYASKEKLQEWMPFEIVSDGEVIALVVHVDSQGKGNSYVDGQRGMVKQNACDYVDGQADERRKKIVEGYDDWQTGATRTVKVIVDDVLENWNDPEGDRVG